MVRAALPTTRNSMTFDLSSLGWDDAFASSYARFAGRDHRPGRITRVDRGVCSVITVEGAHRASLGGCLLVAAAQDPVRLPCAGDWVVMRAWPDERTTIEAVLPRRTAVVRAGAGAAALAQVLAANLDAAAVVEPVDPAPDLGRIERLLALAWESGATPVVVLTKMDQAAHPKIIVEEVAEVAPGVAVHGVSATEAVGLEQLRPYVAVGRTLGLLGQSGAGKSSLVNALVGAAVMGTQTIRRADGRGRHTTPYRALVPIPGGGAVVDTPGIRAVGLFDTVAGLEHAFADIDALARRCRFGDCGHTAEPGCAVAAAAGAGQVTPRRLESWRRLRREIQYEMRRHAARLAADEHERRRRIRKDLRSRHR
jgi:ribosome biogenesis GTPase